MTTSITIKIDTSNDAFSASGPTGNRGQEVAAILLDLAQRYQEDGVGVLSRPLKDSNGNTCGSLKDVVRDRKTRSAK